MVKLYTYLYIMENEFVNYDQCLELKLLGFDELCLSFFKYEEFRIPNPHEPFKNSELKDWFVTAPLWQQAFKFLLILVNKDLSFSNKFTISYNEDYLSLFSGGCNMGVYKTEILCLKELIKIAKELI